MMNKQSHYGKELRKGRYSQHNQCYLVTTVTDHRQTVFTDFYLGRIVVQAWHHEHQMGNVQSLALEISCTYFKVFFLSGGADVGLNTVTATTIFVR
jgi:hypothetical protein